ncbi:MAG: DUF2065 domain-containing protein [Rhizobiaceae bacterium]
MNDFVAAVGLLLVVEGVIYGGLPGLARRLATMVLASSENQLRLTGIAAAIIGVGIVWLVRG